MMATEVHSGYLDSAPSSRLEVSVDGLTLSPDSEVEQGQPEEPPSPQPDAAAEPDVQTPATLEANNDGGDGESDKSSAESKWGFPLQELYGMALKFFKGMPGVHFECLRMFKRQDL